MIKVLLHGQAFPGEGFSLSNFPSMPFEDSNSSAINLSLSITNGQITVECEMADFIPSNESVYLLYVRAMDFVGAAVNVVSLAFGEGKTFILDRLTDQTGKTWNIRPRDKQLAALFTVTQFASQDFMLLIQIVMSRPLLNFALRDLVQAKVSPRLLPLNAARAVETIRHLMLPDSARKQQWTFLQDNLNIDRSYIELITEQAHSHRHGEHLPVTNWDMAEIELRAWTIINRYLHYSRQNKQLDLEAFPRLSADLASTSPRVDP